MPPRLITAMSVVPPPISTTMFPCGSVIGSPAPIAAAVVRFTDKVLEHLLSHFKVGNHSVSHRPDGNDVARRPAQHLLRVLTDSLDSIRHLINSDNGGFAQYDAPSFGVHKGVGGAEIDGQVVGTQSGEQREGHLVLPQLFNCEIEKIGKGQSLC